MRRLAIILLPALLLVCATACTPRRVVIDLAPGDQALRQSTVIAGDDRWLGANRVALVDVTGMILNNPQPRLIGYGEHPVSLLHEQLQRAAADAKVKAVILRMNTPGGTVTASDAMYREVQRFRKRTDKPVVVLMMDMATSGGYYVACAADRIIAYPTSMTGSIGVIIQTFSLEPAMTRFGIEAEALTSGPNKDAGSPFSRMTEAHRTVLQGLVDDYYGRFVDIVRERRPDIADDDFDRVTDGRVMSGERAAEVGLVDATGDIYDAFAAAKNMAGIARADLVRYHRPTDPPRSPYAGAPGASPGEQAGTQVNVLQLNVDGLAGLNAPLGIYYLWQPQIGGGNP